MNSNIVYTHPPEEWKNKRREMEEEKRRRPNFFFVTPALFSVTCHGGLRAPDKMKKCVCMKWEDLSLVRMRVWGVQQQLRQGLFSAFPQSVCSPYSSTDSRGSVLRMNTKPSLYGASYTFSSLRQNMEIRKVLWWMSNQLNAVCIGSFCVRMLTINYKHWFPTIFYLFLNSTQLNAQY